MTKRLRSLKRAGAAVLAVLAGSVGLAAHAEYKPLFPVLACPTIGTEFEKMLANLDSIKTSIKKDANCENVTLKVSSLQELVVNQRQKVMDIIKAAGQSPLTSEQSQVVRDYAENLTRSVAALNDLFTQRNHCFRGHQPEQSLAALAGFVGEAAQLVGSVAGPWGTPVALTGNVVAGFLTGLDQVLKSRAGYNFNRVEQWRSYVNNLCTYHNYRDQIAHLLHPEARLEQLQALRTKLEEQIAIMARDCTECDQIRREFPAHKSESEATLRNLFSGPIASADGHHDKPLGSYMMQSLGVRDWVDGEMDRIRQEARSYWGDAPGRYLLANAKADLENFLLEREAPKFIRFGVEQSAQDYLEFTNFVARDLFAGDGRSLYLKLDQANPELLKGRVDNIYWTDALSVFRALILQPIDWDKVNYGPAKDDLQYAWSHFREESLNRFHGALTSTEMVTTYCTFFKRAGFYNPRVQRQCSGAAFNAQAQELEALATELEQAGVEKIKNLATPLDAGSTQTEGRSRVELMTETLAARRL